MINIMMLDFQKRGFVLLLLYNGSLRILTIIINHIFSLFSQTFWCFLLFLDHLLCSTYWFNFPFCIILFWFIKWFIQVVQKRNFIFNFFWNIFNAKLKVWTINVYLIHTVLGLFCFYIEYRIKSLKDAILKYKKLINDSLP